MAESQAQALDHLPEGFEPGPQTVRVASRSSGSSVMLPAMALLFIACFIGIPLVVVSVTEAEGAIYAILGLLAVVFPIAIYLVTRRLRPPAAGYFEVLADPVEVERGERVEAGLTIYDVGAVGDRIEVGLVCVERYDHPVSRREGADTVVERAIGEEVVYEHWVPAWRTEDEQVLELRVPLDAPYSHEGECLSYAWRVSARAADGTNGDGISDAPIWVLP